MPDSSLVRFFERADEFLFARYSFKLRVERAVFFAMLGAERLEIAGRIPAVRGEPPAAWLVGAIKSGAEITARLPEQGRPHAVRAISDRERTTRLGAPPGGTVRR